ncbi:MAG: hypothetical protein IPI35_29700 [Deltaproteobacteria bacterium]|nr:hypothetical protein [Deltaproteobacteria bacterium]
MRTPMLTLLLVACASGCDDPNPLLEDRDRDGSPYLVDCDDHDGSIHPDAPDPVDAEGIDSNCDGVDGVDADGDRAASTASGGTDCDDADPETHPDAPDSVDSDGIDSNCDGVDGVDDDDDGFASIASGGLDCDDLLADINPGALDPVDPEGVDSNCDGIDGVDEDNDNFASIASGGTDCDDLLSTAFPGAPEVCGDGVVNDCAAEGTTAARDTCRRVLTLDEACVVVEAEEGYAVRFGELLGDPTATAGTTSR